MWSPKIGLKNGRVDETLAAGSAATRKSACREIRTKAEIRKNSNEDMEGKGQGRLAAGWTGMAEKRFSVLATMS